MDSKTCLDATDALYSNSDSDIALADLGSPLVRTTRRGTTDKPSGCGSTTGMRLYDGAESARGALTALGVVARLPDIPHLAAEESLSWLSSALYPCSAPANLHPSNSKRTRYYISA